MKCNKLADMETFLKSKPSKRKLNEWLDAYSVTQNELIMIIKRQLKTLKKMQDKGE